MPVAVSYPGVYIEELSSGVHAITGVATSITAFVGRALRGPTDEDADQSPVIVNSFGDFERVFGGVWLDSAMSFAVNDFFLNGGNQAVIVRLYHNKEGGAPNAKIISDTLHLIAANPGTWANSLRVRIDYDTRPNDDGSEDTTLFNLSVRDGETGRIEVFRNVTHLPDLSNSIDKVLENQSSLVNVDGGLPGARPAKHGSALDPGKGLWDDNAVATNTKVLDADKADDGDPLAKEDFLKSADDKEGIYSLLKADLFNLLCIPPYNDGDVDTEVITPAAALCETRRAFLILDPPTAWSSKAAAVTGAQNFGTNLGTSSKNAAVFFPRITRPNPERGDQVEDFAPCGAVAGVFARTDATRGVWKAPAGLEATLNGAPAFSVPLTDAENGELNPLGVNCLRTLPGAGQVVWGSRTLHGADRLADTDWKYIPVRRLALFLEESLYRGTQWAVFEPNDEPLWAFMQGLFRQGAFAGQTPRDAYFVKCDHETTTPSDVNLGVVNVLIGFAPLRPAEFVILQFQQMAGQIAT